MVAQGPPTLGIRQILAKVFGTQNERELKRIRPLIADTNAREAEIQALTDAQLRAKTQEFKQRLAGGATVDDVLVEAFAVVREAGRRTLNMRHFDVQLIGGIVLHRGRIAEMKTGEGQDPRRHAVFIGGAYGDRGGGGSSRDAPPKAVLGRPFVGEPGSISTETYICIGPFTSESETKNVTSYIACKLTRFLVMLHKPAQHATRKVYTFVPTQDFSKPWTDQKLYAKYGLSDEEVAFVEWMIRPMHLNSDTPDEVVPCDDE